MNNHTPGEWRVRQAADSPSKIIYVGPERENRKIATVHGFDIPGNPKPSERVDADARLIAAVPDLLAICQRLVHWRDYEEGDIDEVPYQIADDARVIIATTDS